MRPFRLSTLMSRYGYSADDTVPPRPRILYTYGLYRRFVHTKETLRGRRRSQIEIIGLALRATVSKTGATKTGATKTEVMDRALLNDAQAEEYLGLLEIKGLVSRGIGFSYYTLTEKGLHVLHTFEKMTDDLELATEITANDANIIIGALLAEEGQTDLQSVEKKKTYS